MLKIKVAGSGCPNCLKLEKLCKEVVSENEISAQIEKVMDLKEIVQLGIMATPGLIVNDKILSSGKIPTKSTLEHWLKSASN